ncbi:OmpH family outer membrane protein [Psychrosphaera haliotis]|uniref:OmpH family outer membrane protein n=1 Tax=Psychrosphaera haliotis TaxID=555083 RepID=A0A6N8F8Z6_9GAMM|nr:OmpH family outer membrane protein [Psychrosphaera haliotis]MUH71557.1 OmpH family outer membrane protein [Psychrosphaera haliotis]
MTLAKKILALTTGILFSVTAWAESIAVVDVQKVVAQLPQMAAMQQQLQKEFAGAAEEVEKLKSDIQFSMEKFQRESMTMSQEQQEKLRTDIEQMQQSYQAKAQPLQENIRRRQGEERNKIMAIIKTAVDEVAAEKKIDVVLQAQSVAFVKPEKDISELVLEKASKAK